MGRREVDEDQGDALTAADEGARQLTEGRYGGVVGDRPGMLERVFTPTRSRWQAHLRGWACKRCGPSVHARAGIARHDWWHRWLDAMFGAIGGDVDALEGEVAELRADLAEVEAVAAAAVAQVRVLTALIRPRVADDEPVVPR